MTPEMMWILFWRNSISYFRRNIPARISFIAFGGNKVVMVIIETD